MVPAIKGPVIRRHPWLLPLLLAVMVLGCWYFTARASKGDRELPVYVLGGERMAAGEEIYRRGADNKPFTYPPFAAVPFVPFAWLPDSWEPGAWFIVNFLLLLGIVVVLHRFGRRDAESRGPPRIGWYWVLTLLLGGHHVLSVFSNQSHDLLIAGLVALTAVTWSRGSALAGVWAGAGAAIKATPLLFVGLFLVRFRFVPLAFTLGAFALLSLMPDWFFPRADGQSWLLAWFDINLRGLEVGGTASASGAWNAHSYLNQGLSGTLTRLFTAVVVPGRFTETVVLADLGPAGCRIVTLVAQAGILAVLTFAVRAASRAVAVSADPESMQRTVGFGEVAAFACGMVLLSPQSSKAHFCIWLFPAAFVVDRLLRGPRDRLLFGLMIGVLLCGPLASKGIVGRDLGNTLLAYGNVTWCTLLLLLATVRVLWTQRRSPGAS